MILRWRALVLGGGLVILGGLVGCSPPPAKVAAQVKTVHILQQKVEIAEAMKKMARDYGAEHPGVRLVIETIGGGQDFDAALADRFQAGNLPDVFMSLGDLSFDPWVPYAEDLTEEPWVKDLRPGTGEAVTRQGRLYGNPLAIEGYGFLYNKALFRRAGITEPPQTLAALAAACAKLSLAGIRPFSNGYAEWWVLGVHNFNILLGAVDDLEVLVTCLETGRDPGAQWPVIDGWMTLLDLTSRYGAPHATVDGNYAASVAEFLAGQAAMIQQGNWIEPDVASVDPALDIGVLPMPVGTGIEDRYPMGVPNFWVINNKSPVRAEAKAWLTWLWKSQTGHQFLLNELKVIPPYTSLEAEPLGALSAPFGQAWKEGRTLPWVFPRFQDRTKSVAAAMRSYLEHPQSHREFWQALVQAWKKP